MGQFEFKLTHYHRAAALNRSAIGAFFKVTSGRPSGPSSDPFPRQVAGAEDAHSIPRGLCSWR